MKPLERIHIWFLKSDQYIKKKILSHAEIEKKLKLNQLSHLLYWPTNPTDEVDIEYFVHKENHFVKRIDNYSRWVDVKNVKHCNTSNTKEYLCKSFSQYGKPI